MAQRKTKRADAPNELFIGVKVPNNRSKETIDSTTYTDSKGKEITAIRCGQCKGKGCEGCSGLGFLIQESLL